MGLDCIGSDHCLCFTIHCLLSFLSFCFFLLQRFNCVVDP